MTQYLSLDDALQITQAYGNHPLFDGNRRTGWTIMVAFLWINGFHHDFTTDDGFDLVVGVAEGTIDIDSAEVSIRMHRTPRQK